MDKFLESAVTIAVAIIGLATIAVLVSRNAQTPQVISSAGSSFAQSLGVAVSPVTGGGGYANPAFDTYEANY